MKKITLYWKINIIFFVLAIVLNLLAFIPGFCDLYTVYVYRFIAELLARITSPIPFCLGEILMYIGIGLIVLAFILIIALIFLRKRKGFVRFFKGYMKSLLLIIVLLLFSFTINWSLPYQTTELLFGTDADRQYTFDELVVLEKYFADNLNRLTFEIPRDQDGHPIVSDTDMDSLKKGLSAVGEELSVPCDFFPNDKNALCSDFLEWMNIGGFTIPCTKEILGNKYNSANRMFYYTHVAHETAHHMGFFRENEGTFIGCLACIRSDDPLIQYSGYYSAYSYLMKNIRRAMKEAGWSKAAQKEKLMEMALYSSVYDDYSYFYDLYLQMYRENVNTVLEENFQGVSESVAEVGWDTQAKVIGKTHYDNVTELLLRYYLQ